MKLFIPSVAELEIFVGKIFSWFAQTTKIKNTKYILQRIFTIARIFLFAQFHSAASLLFRTRRSLRYQHVTRARGKRATTFRSVSDAVR